MLPDYPKAKLKIRKSIEQQVYARTKEKLGPFGLPKTSLLFEGTRNVLIREDGSILDTHFRQFSAQVSVDLESTQPFNPGLIEREVEELSKSLADQQGKHMVEFLNNACESTGNIVQSGTGELDPTSLLELLGKREWDFYDDGRPHFPEIVVSPEMADQATLVLNEMNTNPIYQKQFKDLLERKRLEWRDREANRKLVG